MIKRFLKFLFIYVLTLSFIYTPLLRAEQLSLPSADLIAPQVIHENISEPAAPDSNQTFSATVTDNVGVQSVTLFYRNVGSKDYKRKPMSNSGSSTYSAVVDAREIREPGIEYYIQATDSAGNNLLHGYSFSPLMITVSAATAAKSASSAVKKETALAPKEEKSNKWLWIGLGALAVAVAAGGGGGGESGSAPTPTATLTITTTEP